MKNISDCITVVLILFIGILSSCEEDDKTIIIPEVEEIQFFPGYERAKIAFNLEATRSAKEIVVFWDNLKEQKVIPINQNSSENQYEVLLENLTEGTIEFNIYVRDEDNNKSALKSVRGHIYGDKYIETLKNRMFEESEVTPEKAVVKWQASPAGAAEFEIEYMDNDGNYHTVTFEPRVNITTLTNARAGEKIRFRIKYLPESNMLDPFYCNWEEVQIGLAPLEEFLLDKSKIVEHHLTNDRAGQHHGGSIAKLFDDVIHVDNFYSSGGGELPLTFTFDLGQSVIMSKLTITGRIAIPDRIPHEFDVWAINDISNADTETPTAEFAAWETESLEKGWKKLGEFKDEYGAPEPDPDWNNPPIRDFKFKEDRESQYRYIRIRIMNTWQTGVGISSQEVNIGEIDVFGKR